MLLISISLHNDVFAMLFTMCARLVVDLLSGRHGGSGISAFHSFLPSVQTLAAVLWMSPSQIVRNTLAQPGQTSATLARTIESETEASRQ